MNASTDLLRPLSTQPLLEFHFKTNDLSSEADAESNPFSEVIEIRIPKLFIKLSYDSSIQQLDETNDLDYEDIEMNDLDYVDIETTDLGSESLPTCKCGRVFKLMGNLNYHMKWECGKQVKCNHCQKHFQARGSLLKHYRRFPSHIKVPKKRPVPAKKGGSGSNSAKGKSGSGSAKGKSVSGSAKGGSSSSSGSENRHACKCGRSFTEKKKLTYHQKWECGKVLKCKVCKKTFRLRQEILSHFRKFPKHEKGGHEVDSTRIICKCGRSFTRPYKLTYHHKWECGKVVACDACGKTFNLRDDLLRHWRLDPSHNIAKN